MPKHSARPRYPLLTSLRWLAGIATAGALAWIAVKAPSAWWLPVVLGVVWALLMWWIQPLGGIIVAESREGPRLPPVEKNIEAPPAPPIEDESINVPGSLSVGDGGPSGEIPPPPDEPPKNGGHVYETTEPTRSARSAPETEPVRFRALYPARIAAEGSSPFWAYAFKPSELVEIAEDADLLEADHGPVTSSSATAREGIKSGVVLVAKPEGEGLRFDPPQQSAVWRERWRRFDFRVAVEAGHPARLQGRVSFTVEGLLIAEVPFELTIGDSPAGQTARSQEADPYQAVFPSYSHRDQQIVERVERAYRALGMSYLRDVTTLRSGQQWRPELGRLIEQADLFQLFWSSAAATSEYVTEEWQTALRLISEKKKPETFIRPVYWEQPMPAPPTPLGATHFAYEPNLEE